MSTPGLFQRLHLACGMTLANRIVKAAMEENLADARHAPGPALQRLYAAWAQGGAGMLITGNVMIDRQALTGPGGVVLENDAQLPQFAAWAQAGKRPGTRLIMQINHPGRQVQASMGQPLIAPSALAVTIPGMSKLFAIPSPMTAADIAEVVARFARTAALAERAGFDGVQIHAAHGYLISQFLSPLSNVRTDDWGGVLNNRARLLCQVVTAVRRAVAPTFCVAIKLNSADFQRGGFDTDDAIEVIRLLATLGIDFVELSGGSYESPAMRGLNTDGRTLAREAHFLALAQTIRRQTTLPLMLTGGITRRPVAERVLQDGMELVGMASALALQPNLPNHWRAGDNLVVQPQRLAWKNKALAATAASALIKRQLLRLSRGQSVRLQASPLLALASDQLTQRCQTRRYRQWINTFKKETHGAT